MSPAPAPIEGVETATAAFIGPTREGPLTEPQPVTSLAEFEASFGGRAELTFGRMRLPNYLWLATRAFFKQGGARLYIQRVAGAGGARPAAGDYRGGPASGARRRGLRALERLGDVGLVAAPGSTHGLESGYGTESLAIARALITHAERCGDRFALIDGGRGQTRTGVESLRSELESSRAAVYHPWLLTKGPPDGEFDVAVPPSGFVAGALAAGDVERGIWKAPNRPLKGVLGLDVAFSTGDQEAIQAAGVNVIRSFGVDNHRIWGSRTLTANPEWKYVNISRFLIYLERSIDRGIQWAAFEPNSEPTWNRVRGLVEDFLIGEWRRGALLGARAEEALFVRCDRTTMTQADIDAGRLICMIGVAPVRPAEFVILRIGRGIDPAG